MDTVTCPQTMTLLVESTKNQGSMTGQEERNILFANFSLNYSDFCLSSNLGLPSEQNRFPPLLLLQPYLRRRELILWLVELGEKKSWLRESAWFAISLAVDALHKSEVEWEDDAISKALDILFQTNSVWSTEKLALVLNLQDYYPKHDWKALLSPIFKNIDILSTGNLPTTLRILKVGIPQPSSKLNIWLWLQESTTDEDGIKDSNKAPSGTWKPQLNFAWDIILDQLLPGPNSQRPAKGSFQDFFRIVVDGEFSLANGVEQDSVNLMFGRVLIFVDFLSTTEILGIPSLPEISEGGNRREHANVIYQKLHAVMD